MKKFLFFIFFCLSVTIFAQTYHLPNFHVLNIHARQIKVLVHYGDPSITFSDQKGMKYWVSGKVLNVQYFQGHFFTVNIYTNKSIDRVQLSHGSLVQLDSKLIDASEFSLMLDQGSHFSNSNLGSTQNLLVNLSQGSHAQLNIQAQKAKVQLEQGSHLSNSAHMDKVQVKLDQGSSMQACHVKELSGDLSQGSHLKVSPSTKKNVFIRQGSSIDPC